MAALRHALRAICRNRVSMPVAGHLPHTTDISSIHHRLRQAGRLGKIIFGDQKVTLLGDPWRIAKPGADHV